MTSIQIGSNAFNGVPFPLVLVDRYFHIYELDGSLKVDVFRWIPAFKTAVYEVVSSVPVAERIESNPNGDVLFTSENGSFAYKFRPDPEKTQLFGKIPVTDELSVELKDHALRVYRDGALMVDASNNSFVGSAIGILIDAEGNVAFGVSALPDGMDLTVRGNGHP
ncbi:hypothetical protein [Aeromicrobium sp. HA]|uniref:hypothetical protein n=1 Tax=Aeromicrobium sp. HA TaxID=3009077 RepID=UPI0022B0239C|nr:hypothetical protein [Aeromicrobium sp. HA]